jgi:hypothetical protein
MKDDLATEAREALDAFMEMCLRCHPKRSEFLADMAEKRKAAGSMSESPGITKRLRMRALGNLLGLDEKAPDGPKPTPVSGVAS